MVINQGDIFWVDLEIPFGSMPGYRRPCVVIQNDALNNSHLRTVLVCALTSNVKLAAAMGNVLLAPKEGNLSKQSVVNVSQIFTVDKALLEEKIGTLSAKRVRSVIDGVNLMLEPRDSR